MATNRAQYKKVNTIGWSASQLQNIGSEKAGLSQVGGVIGRQGGSTKKVYK